MGLVSGWLRPHVSGNREESGRRTEYSASGQAQDEDEPTKAPRVYKFQKALGAGLCKDRLCTC